MVDTILPRVNWLACFLVLAALLVSGCGANFSSIHRKDGLSKKEGTVILTDAKQRAIIASPQPLNSSSDGSTSSHQNSVSQMIWRVCSEPPPDVFSALAASLAGQAGLTEGGDPLSKEVSLALSSSFSENAATIRRTQTVNILRESMFRTCERYLSGAIGKAEFIVQAARDQRAMVAVLAIEQLTGVHEAQATALITTARAQTGKASNESLATLEKAREAALAAKKTATEKRSEADSSNPANVDCETAKTSGDSAHAAKKALCHAADAAAKDHKSAEDYYHLVAGAVKDMSGVLSEASGAVQTGNQDQCCTAASAAMAQHVVEIVKEVGRFDELGMTCVVIFRMVAEGVLDLDDPVLKNTELIKACNERIAGELQRDEAGFRLEAARLNTRAAAIETEFRQQIGSQAEIVWNYILTAGRPDPEKFDALARTAEVTVPPSTRQKLLGAAGLADFTLIYPLLGPDNERKLAEAANR